MEQQMAFALMIHLSPPYNYPGCLDHDKGNHYAIKQNKHGIGLALLTHLPTAFPVNERL